MGRTAGIVAGSVSAGVAVLGLAAAAVVLGCRRGKGRTPAKRGGVGSVLLRSLSKRPANWYDALPVWELKNKKGMRVEISSVGAAITKLIVPDKKGKKADVVLGYDTQSQYVHGEPVTYFGVVVGRCANRIANAQFTLEGETYKLMANNGENALHGGALGLHKRVWDGREISGDGFTAVELTYDSPHGEEGYPGSVYVTVTYKLYDDRNELQCSITASVDEATPVNIAQHSYFNLAGHASGTILGHKLRLPQGDHYTPVNPKTLIPTGEIVPVNGTPFDFASAEHVIGDRIAQVEGGYDHNYVLHAMGPQARFIVRKNGSACDKPKLAAVVKEPTSGRCMEVYTTAPGVQFYSGNFLDGNVQGKGGAKYVKHGGFCLETQGFPNAVNTANFPSVVLPPKETYVHDTVYRFFTEK